MIKHKRKTKAGNLTWCGATEGEAMLHWQDCNCEKCFDAAIFGRKKMGKYMVPIDAIIREQARSFKMMRKDKGELK